MNRSDVALIVALLGAAAPAAGQHRTPPAWTQGATCYEIFVRSFADSDGDGIGDFAGLTARLDYLNDGDPDTRADLGVRCLWLMPVAESPSYHGYDVSDYYRVEPDYGTADDFRRFIAEAHRRGIRVLVDLVLNHASSEHPAFRAALADTTSPYRGWFRFLPRHPGTRSPWGGDNWHRSPLREEYYYGFFWQGMPDLDLQNTAVRAETRRIADFWLRDMGVDGFRLDAIKFLVEEGDIIENTAGTHAFLREFGAHVRATAPDAFTIGEVWDSTGPLLAYYPDQLDGHFAFEVSDSILAAVRSGSARGLLAPVLRLQAALPAWRWSPFLRNHDQTRTLTVLEGDVARARLAAALLLTLPGLPFVYYGEEIGMTGDKPDERIRTPMQWTADPGAGFTTGTPWQPLALDWQRTSVAAQHEDSTSLLAQYRRLIQLRAQSPALGTGELVPLTASHGSVAAWLRREGADVVLVVANLGDTLLTEVRLDSDPLALASGRYRASDLLGGRAAAPLRVNAAGAVRGYVPRAMLAPRELYVFSLRRE